MRKSKPLSIEELTDIFNTILDSHCFRFLVHAFGDTHRDYYAYLEFGGTHEEFEKTQPTNREKFSKYFTNKELIEIEYKLIVFENIPRNIIYKIIEDFLEVILEYKKSKSFQRREGKKISKEAHRLIKKDIRIIQAYQDMIFNYTSDNDYNNDEYSIEREELDEVYQFNKVLLEELKTKKYRILDFFRYGGMKMFPINKNKIQNFFDNLKIYNLTHSNIKDMIDIL